MAVYYNVCRHTGELTKSLCESVNNDQTVCKYRQAIKVRGSTIQAEGGQEEKERPQDQGCDGVSRQELSFNQTVSDARLCSKSRISSVPPNHFFPTISTALFILMHTTLLETVNYCLIVKFNFCHLGVAFLKEKEEYLQELDRNPIIFYLNAPHFLHIPVAFLL